MAKKTPQKDRPRWADVMSARPSGKSSNRRVIVVGAGASGLMAAGSAALHGAEVFLLEKNHKAGIKLALTGHGRCNLSHDEDLADFIGHYFGQGKFLRQAFGEFFWPDLVSFLGEHGVETICEPSRRIFPASGRAADIVRAFELWMQQLRIGIHCEVTATRLAVSGNQIHGVDSNMGLLGGDAVIVACGGSSYPVTGSTGDSYALAAAAGHTIIPPRPSLVPIVTAGKTAKRLMGVSLQDIAVTAFVDNQPVRSCRGDILFTHFGLSGPAVLNLSRDVTAARAEGKAVEISLDLLPDRNREQLDSELRGLFSSEGKRNAATILGEIIPRKLTDTVLGRCDLADTVKAGQVSAEIRRRLADTVKDFRLAVVGDRGFEDAITTAGGVELREIDPRTMESRLVKGLYFCGEALNIDGESGGYNLQAAFSTGWLAGRSAGSVM